MTRQWPPRSGICDHGRLWTTCRPCKQTGGEAGRRQQRKLDQRTDGLPAYFPYDEARECQVDFIQTSKTALKEGKPFIVHAPTGVGKTVSALTAVLEPRAEDQRLVLFLSGRKTQRAIVMSEPERLQDRFPRPLRATDLASKQDLCIHPRAKEAPTHGEFVAYCEALVKAGACPAYQRFRAGERPRLSALATSAEVKERSEDLEVCPYEVASERTAESDVVVLDYNHIFGPLWDLNLERFGKESKQLVLVVDEAHNLVDRARQNHTHEVRASQLSAVAKAVDAIAQPGFARFLHHAHDHLVGAAANAADGLHPWNADALGPAPLDLALRTFELEALASKEAQDPLLAASLRLVSRFLRQWFDPAPQGRFLVKEEGETWLETGLLDPRPQIRDRLRSVSGTILMSGTLHPTTLHRDSFGLRPEQVTERTYASPYPRENRPVFYDGALTSIQKERGDATYNGYAERVAAIWRRLGRNVAAFFVSYAFMTEVAKHVDADIPVVMERPGMTRADRDRVLHQLERGRNDGGRLLLAHYSGSFSEGVDFRDNLLHAIALCGIPLATLDARTKALTSYYRSKMGPDAGDRLAYDVPAITRVVQAAGRGIRSEADVCEIHFLDRRFLEPRYQALLPADLRQA